MIQASVTPNKVATLAFCVSYKLALSDQRWIQRMECSLVGVEGLKSLSQNHTVVKLEGQRFKPRVYEFQHPCSQALQSGGLCRDSA